MSGPSREAAVAELADLLAGKALDGWARLVWRATLSSGMFQERLEVVLASGAVADAATTVFRMGLVMDSHGSAAARRLGAALRAADGGVWHTVELTVEPGRIAAVASTVLTQSTGYLPPTYRVAVDTVRAVRPVEHGSDGGEPKAASGDPRRVVELAGTYGEFYAQLMGEPLKLRPPATEDEIASAEATLGVTLPPDLRALYGMADGEDNNYGLFGGPTLLPLVHVVDQWNEYSALDEDPTSVHDDRVTIESHPPGTIRRASWHPRWVPFATHHDGNFFAVDLAPGPDGTVGQVIAFGTDYDYEQVTYVAASVTDLLAELVALQEAGDVDVEPGVHFSLYPAYMTVETPTYSHDVTPTQEPLPDWLANLSDPGEVQELWIRKAGEVDLSPLAALPRLRILHIKGGVAVTGIRGLLTCPLEQLTVTAEQTDLTDLAGHPTLRFLTVRDVAEPALRLPTALPSIESLDVSASQLTDISALAHFPTLRNLTLSAPQWTQLLAGDHQPPSLSTAALTGTSSLRDAANWARQVAPATAGSHWEHSATFDPARRRDQPG